MQSNNLIGEGKYEGDMKEGWFHGKGKFTYDNGVIYEGEFSKGRFHGKGTLIIQMEVNSLVNGKMGN